MSEPTLEALRDSIEHLRLLASRPPSVHGDLIANSAASDVLKGIAALERRAEQAEAEVERLKCCGNCVSYDIWQGCLVAGLPTSTNGPSANCAYFPSRWTAREEDR